MNLLTEENNEVKIKLVNRERELKKYEKVIEEIYTSGNLKNLNSKFSSEVKQYQETQDITNNKIEFHMYQSEETDQVNLRRTKIQDRRN